MRTRRSAHLHDLNRMHLARMLKDRGSVPAHGNQRSAREAGCRFDHPNPEYR